MRKPAKNQAGLTKAERLKRQEKRNDIFGISCGVILLMIIVGNIIMGFMPATAGVKDKDVPAEAFTLIGTAPGRNGDLTVEVVMTDDTIYQINIVDHSETEGVGTLAIDQLPIDIFQAQSLKVDAITSATITSTAIKDAIVNALDNGNIDPGKFGGARVLVEKVANKVETGSGVGIKYASDWQLRYPNQYASWAQNSENNEATDYLEDYPMLETLYEPYGFSRDYKSARGHSFNLEDIMSTERIGPNSLASCWTCKAPEFTNMVNEMGDSVYSMAFADLMQQINEPISCYNCHANTPGKLTVTHSYMYDALGEDFENVDAATLACAQCHVEYHFDPISNATTLPYSSLATMTPDAILAFYNDGSNFPDGQPFYDYINPRTGVKQIKVQHPEFETFLGEGSQHRGKYTCADCHMGTAVSADGKTYTSHFLSSPLENTQLIESECSACHVDLVSEVRAIQEEVERRTYTVGYELEYLTERLAEAVESGEYTEEELNAIRALARDAQFYWDFVFVENSEGAHNSTLTHECLDKSATLINEALGMFKR